MQPPPSSSPQSRRQPLPGELHLCRRGSAPGRAHGAMLCTRSRWMALPQTSSTSVWDQAGHSWVLRGSMVRSNPSLPVPQCQGAPAIQRSRASCNSSGVNGSTQLRGWGPQRAGRAFVTQRDGALKPVLVLRRWRAVRWRWGSPRAAGSKAIELVPEICCSGGAVSEGLRGSSQSRERHLCI